MACHCIRSHHCLVSDTTVVSGAWRYYDATSSSGTSISTYRGDWNFSSHHIATVSSHSRCWQQCSAPLCNPIQPTHLAVGLPYRKTDWTQMNTWPSTYCRLQLSVYSTRSTRAHKPLTLSHRTVRSPRGVLHIQGLYSHENSTSWMESTSWVILNPHQSDFHPQSQ